MNEGAPKPKASVPEVTQTKSLKEQTPKTPHEIVLEAIEKDLAEYKKENPDKFLTKSE